MSGAVGSGYAAEQPQCYNCGAPGHWAVACPEPTRQTPAGLAAWRSSSHTHVNGNGGNRDRRGAPKKHKGPIITKYGPPPGQQHPQPPPPPPGGNSYAPSGYHGHAPYHNSGPPLPSHQPPHQPPPSGYHHYPLPPPGYPPQPPPDYAPQHYGHATAQYPPTPHGPPQAPPPPPPYHYDTHPAYGYGQQPPLPPPPPSHYHQPPPSHRPYPEPEHERRRHQSSPPPPPPGYGPPASAHGAHGSHRGQKGVHSSGSHSRQHSQGHHRNERNQAHHQSSHTPKKNPGQQSKGPTQTSGPISLPAPLMHSLPPKPPQSKHLQPEQGPRGKNNKRKQDRQNRQKGNKQRQRDRSKDRKDRAQEHPEESEQADRPPDRPPSRSTVSTEPQGGDKKVTGDTAGTIGAVEAKSVSPQEPVLSVPETSAAQDVDSPARPTSPVPEVDEWTWEFSHIFKIPDAVHEPDEIGRPLPFSYHDDILLPRKWDAHCIASEFVSPDNLELYIRPVHETEYWPHIEFDPAFVVEGKFPCGESIPKHLLTGEAPPESKATAPSLREEHSRKRSFTESADEERSNKRHRPSADRRVDSYVPSRSADGRPRTRSRSRQRRSDSRSPPPRSRRSSASSLNSLEAELLGISETHDSPEPGTPRRLTSSGRRDDSRSPQTQRRRPRTDSAYSRRW